MRGRRAGDTCSPRDVLAVFHVREFVVVRSLCWVLECRVNRHRALLLDSALPTLPNQYGVFRVEDRFVVGIFVRVKIITAFSHVLFYRAVLGPQTIAHLGVTTERSRMRL